MIREKPLPALENFKGKWGAMVWNFLMPATKKSSFIGFAGVQTPIDSVAAYHVGENVPPTPPPGGSCCSPIDIILDHQKSKISPSTLLLRNWNAPTLF
jgi:hypothetical protein